MVSVLCFLIHHVESSGNRKFMCGDNSWLMSHKRSSFSRWPLYVSVRWSYFSCFQFGHILKHSLRLSISTSWKMVFAKRDDFIKETFLRFLSTFTSLYYIVRNEKKPANFFLVRVQSWLENNLFPNIHSPCEKFGDTSEELEGTKNAHISIGNRCCCVIMQNYFTGLMRDLCISIFCNRAQ